MTLGDIKRGTKMAIFKNVDNRASGSALEAEFRHSDTAMTYIVNSLPLYNNYDSWVNKTQFIVAFEIGPMLYTFGGRLKQKITK